MKTGATSSESSVIRPASGLRIHFWCLLSVLLFLAGAAGAQAQTNAGAFSLNIGMNGLNQAPDVDSAIKVVAIMTLLTLAPSIILLMTCFTRIVIVLSFVRSALSVQGTPSNQIIVGLSLFLTFFIMAPRSSRIARRRSRARWPWNAPRFRSARSC
jgi:flagellar biosynthetic protein FliP